MTREFNNTAESGFYDYLLTRGYQESTAWHYIQRIRIVAPLDQILGADIDRYIAEYETGAHAECNVKSHKAYSNALKRLREYMVHKGLLIV